MRDVSRLLLQERPTQILLAARKLENAYISTIAKDVDCTYAHASRVIKQMKKLGLVKLTARGRVKYVALTPVGEKAAKALQNVTNLDGS